MQTWTDMQLKAQRLTKDSNSDVLTQLSQDMNTGYHMFNAKLARYFTRKQQFADLVAGQQIYQTPVDSVKVLVVTAIVTSTYEPPLEPVRSEYDWRLINTTKSYKTNWPTFYFPLGNDKISIWPIPSQNITNGMRFVYQPQDHDLSIQDVTSTSTGTTVTVTNGTTLVTATGAAFTSGMIGLHFQLTGVTDLSDYEIVAVPSGTTLTLKSAFVGPSGGSFAWRIGQVTILPQEYADAPMHYALGNYFSANGNEQRAAFHLGQDMEGKRGWFYAMMDDCLQSYSSSNESSVITDDDYAYNMWKVLPPAATP